MSNIINDTVYEYMRGFYCPLSDALAEMRDYAEKHRVPIILPDAEALLLQLIRMKRPKRILEVGTAIGYSASCFAVASPESRIITIEAEPHAFEIAQSNFRKLGLEDRITILPGEGQTVIPGLEGEDRFDFVFIDAAKSHYRSFWDAAIRLCCREAVIVCDNVLMKGMTASDEYDSGRRYKTSIRRMREFLAYITNLKTVDTAVLPVGDGISVSLLKG